MVKHTYQKNTSNDFLVVVKIITLTTEAGTDKLDAEVEACVDEALATLEDKGVQPAKDMSRDPKRFSTRLSEEICNEMKMRDLRLYFMEIEMS